MDQKLFLVKSLLRVFAGCQTKYEPERVHHVISTANERCNGRIDLYVSIFRTTDLVFSFKKCTRDKIYVSQERNMYAKVPKTMGIGVPAEIDINGYCRKIMGNIPGMQR